MAGRMSVYLVLDCNYLCHRVFHTAVGKLSFRQGDAGRLNPTGVIYGFLRDVRAFMDLHLTSKIVFAFDHGISKRRQALPTYKMRKLALTPEECKGRAPLYQQINMLREGLLYKIGFCNIFWQDGYEADDVIASVVQQSINPADEAIIISADQDLWQLLSDRVSTWNPQTKESVTEESFRLKWGISPAAWPTVKAWAGCASDNIRGVAGVGEKTAVKWILGLLRSTIKLEMFRNEELFQRNLPLVRLPWSGVNRFELVEDKVTVKGWQAAADRLGMKSIRQWKHPGRSLFQET